MAESRLQVVGQEDSPDPFPVAPPKPPVGTRFAGEAIALALAALSQRAIIALASLFTLLTVASAFWLALQIAANPTTYQIVVLAIYLMFVSAVNIIARTYRK